MFGLQGLGVKASRFESSWSWDFMTRLSAFRVLSGGWICGAISVMHGGCCLDECTVDGCLVQKKILQ